MGIVVTTKSFLCGYYKSENDVVDFLAQHEQRVVPNTYLRYLCFLIYCAIAVLSISNVQLCVQTTVLRLVNHNVRRSGTPT